ncbi:MAG: hypothetical protein RR294_06890 [Bacilli bacterium]
MLGSIFDIEVRIDINKEFRKMVKYFQHTENTTFYKERCYSLIGAIDKKAFKKWPYRGTAINCEEYLDNIGLSCFCFTDGSIIEKDKFLYYLEFIYNIIKFSAENSYIRTEDETIIALIANIFEIAEKINYKFVECGDKCLLLKRDADVDVILELVDEDIAKLLLEYNDFKVKADLHRKREILKSLDIFIEKNQLNYSKLDKDTYGSIGYIMNNFGINHKINSKYKDNDIDLIQWYDKCFTLCIHLIRLSQIREINNERKSLES